MGNPIVGVPVGRGNPVAVEGWGAMRQPVCPEQRRVLFWGFRG